DRPGDDRARARAAEGQHRALGIVDNLLHGFDFGRARPATDGNVDIVQTGGARRGLDIRALRRVRVFAVRAVVNDGLEALAGSLGHVGHADLRGGGEVVGYASEIGHLTLLVWRGQPFVGAERGAVEVSQPPAPKTPQPQGSLPFMLPFVGGRL